MINGRGKIAVLFPGQGSQYVGMGMDFINADPDAEAFMRQAEKVSDCPINKLCESGSIEELTRAVNLQPALTAVNLLCWQALKNQGINPDFFVGHSLGEFSALCAAGTLGVDDTMTLVSERGRLMEREGIKNPGGMVAVVGLVMEEVMTILDDISGIGKIAAANHNSERQVVISGEHIALEKAGEIILQKGGRAIPIKVSVANHSPLVEDAVPDFEKYMESIPFVSPSVPIIFNVTAALESDPVQIRRIMARQIASKVRWFEIMQNLMAQNVRVFIEAGPKNVLTGLLKRIIPKDYDCRRFHVENPESLAKCVSEIKSAS